MNTNELAGLHKPFRSGVAEHWRGSRLGLQRRTRSGLCDFDRIWSLWKQLVHEKIAV